MGVERYYQLAKNPTTIGYRKLENGLPEGGEEHQKYSGGRLWSLTTSRECVAREANKISSNPNLSRSLTPWPRLKDPRIVRASRAFGGKDRHSKVCTIRGLRDWRVRLSVPTAIQLYDHQERLGLNRPSKVVDWLLDDDHNQVRLLPG
ncbi:hypothetical protein C1H46_005426 [Malus baccata]|uniref:TCP domain-containing protein n=1 Tax=Malus baccata TaxID=106549 RepID=A0A540NEL5_MALBA|nr:hypothetical protein C1H46_005426 [Malus baccata]